MARTKHASSRRRLLISRGVLGESVPEELLAPLAPAQPAPPIPQLALPHVAENEGLRIVRRLLRDRRPLMWVCSGDHLVQGAFVLDGHRSCAELFSERLRAEMGRASDGLVNTGVCGDHARQLCKTIKKRVLRFRPDVVCLAIGTNDAKLAAEGRPGFRRAVREILERVRGDGAVPVVQTPNLVDLQACETRRDLPVYAEILRDEAQRLDAPLVDHWSHWQQLETTPGALTAWLGDGRYQPNHLGHRELARLLLHVLGVLDPESAVGRVCDRRP